MMIAAEEVFKEAGGRGERMVGFFRNDPFGGSFLIIMVSWYPLTRSMDEYIYLYT